jgi:hypothetical protein
LIVLRCTQKLLGRVGPPVADPPASTSRLGDWYAKPFAVAQRRFLVVVSGPSRLPVLMPGRDVAALPRNFAGALADVLIEMGIRPEVAAREVEASTEVTIARTDDRSVLGSVNEFALMAQHGLRGDPDADLVALAVWLGRTPVVAGGVRWPCDVARELLSRDGA